MRGSARWLDVGALQDDAGAGEGGDVGHDHLGVVPGHVAPGQVLHGDQDDVGGGGDGGRHQGGCQQQITDHGRTLAWLVLATGWIRTPATASNTFPSREQGSRIELCNFGVNVISGEGLLS